MIVWVEATSCTNGCWACSLGQVEPYRTYYTADELQRLALEWGPVVPLEDATIHGEFPMVLNRSITSDEMTYIGTNGTGIAQVDDPERLFGQLRTYGYQGLYIALHGLARTHDQLVGREGAFDAILLATRRALEAHFQVHWQVYLNSRNLGEIAALVTLAEPLLGGPPHLDFLHHRIHPRVQWYESLRPSIKQVQEQLPADLVTRRWGQSLPQLTEANWIRSWESGVDRDKFRHLFEPQTWPPRFPFERACVAITGNRQVYLDPQCSSPILLGQLTQGRTALLERLQQLTDPSEPCSESWPRYLCDEDAHLLHASAYSVRYKAISRALKENGKDQDGAGSLDFCGHF